MLWITLSILSGLATAILFALLRKLRGMNPYLLLISHHLVTLPFLLVALIYNNIPSVSSYFYFIVLINSLVFTLAGFLIIKSMQISEMSLSIPMLSFTPVFLLLVSFLLLNELPSFYGFVGILIVVIGAYTLNLSSAKYGVFQPIKTIFKNRGVLYMFIVSFLYSISASLTKIGVLLSNPVFFTLMSYFFVTVISTLLFSNALKHINKIGKNFKYIILLGISTAIMEILVATALQFSIVSYVISLKRTSIIFSVIIGYFFFKEKNFKKAILGAAIMFMGALLITLA